ncbi:MAG: S8 family serine peptidase [Clostridium sp.]
MNCSSLPDNQTADFIERFFPFTYNQILDNDSGCYDFVNHEYVIWHRSLAEALPLSVQQYGYDSIPNLYTILDTSSLDSAGISRTAEQTFLGNKGRGALIGIVDTGIDYTNPLLRNPDGSTRIAAIWDQTVPGAGLSTPDPIDALHYGSVYQRSHINEALRSEDPHSIVPTSDPLRHGTQMALVAAGSEDADAFFSGAAPESELVVVRLKPARTYLRDFFLIREDAIAFQEDDIMLGIKFLLYIARQEKKPLVILLGLGTNTGSHSGTSPLGQYRGSLSRASGQILVAAGGMGGAGTIFAVYSSSTSYEDVELRVGPDERGFTLELWAREPELYSVGFYPPPATKRDASRLSGEKNAGFPFFWKERPFTSTIPAPSWRPEAN